MSGKGPRMQQPIPQKRRVEVPAEVVQYIQMQTIRQVVGAAVNMVTAGKFEHADKISREHRLLIAEAMTTLFKNEELEQAPCANCSRVRSQHSLSEDGLRHCNPADMPDDDGPQEDGEEKAPRTFTPTARKVQVPGGGGQGGRIILPGRG